MSLVVPPQRVPTLEPVKDAVAAAVTTHFADAAAYVAALYPAPALTLPPPAQIVIVTVGPSEVAQRWPALFVAGDGIRAGVQADQPQTAAGLWTGTIGLSAWLRDSDAARLARALDRYAAALWLCLLQQRTLGPALLLPETWMIESAEPPGDGGPLTRGVTLSVDVSFRV